MIDFRTSYSSAMVEKKVASAFQTCVPVMVGRMVRGMLPQLGPDTSEFKTPKFAWIDFLQNSTFRLPIVEG